MRRVSSIVAPRRVCVWAVVFVSAVVFLMSLSRVARAEPAKAARDTIPAPLEPWTTWVLTGHESELCPGLESTPDAVRCVWPTRLSLVLGDSGGTFEQRWHVDARAWVPLPGDDSRWPLDVESSGKKLEVVSRSGVPSVQLDPGDHTITGNFGWDALPDSLVLPVETGLVALTLNGEPVFEPSRDPSGRVFLQKSAAPVEGDRLEVLVHRRVTDDIPLALTTRVVLNVSGKSREVLLGKSLPAGFVPMSITSDLPARIEPDSRLRVQVRPGTWTIEVAARSDGPVSSLSRPVPDGPWRDGEEVWVFEAKTALRVVTVEGVRAIDPQQTSLPDAWKALPAYSMGQSDEMRLVEKRRGDVDAPPDQLSLVRTLWLDFDGGGYTVNDTITGAMHRATRLEMNPPTVLGRVAVDGKDQFITRLDGPSAKAGVEIRQGDLHVTADSRITGDARDIPAVGYDHDFHDVSATLHLPPGYRLFHASGADEVPGTWVRQWTLLELFLVLVLSLAFARLFGRVWGVVACVTFVLVFPETDTLEWVWPVALAVEALVRVVPEGRVRSAFSALRLAVLVGLALVALPFLTQRVREGIYPALAEDAESFIALPQFGEAAAPPPMAGALAPAAPASEPVPQDTGGGAMKDRRQATDSLGQSVSSLSKAASPRYRQFNAEVYDPNAMVQTGPGLPSWTWSTTSVHFSGPVERSQRLHLYLLSPPVNLVLALVRAALLALLFVRVLPFTGPRFRRGLRAIASTSAVCCFLTSAHPARADVPSADLLDQLRQRLLQKPDCTPNCASSSRLELEVQNDVLRVRVEIHAAAAIAVPLPGGAADWSPEHVIADGKEATGLVRTDDGKLWIRLDAGTHDLALDGRLAPRESLQIALPLKPHHVVAHVAGWVLEGLHEDGLADDSLKLTRVHAGEGTTGVLSTGPLPPFVRVERTVLIGLNWQVSTKVVRETPPGSAIVLEVPLLAGESVTTANQRVAGGKALINMAPDASEVSFQSVLEEKSPIVLQAPPSMTWSEVWRLDLSPIWHAELAGIPVVHEDAAERMPVWRPWPRESATITLSRPAGVAGQTLTIDSSEVEVSPGLRVTDATASFTVRSSRGVEHTLRLPESAELESVAVNGTPEPLRQRGRSVTLSLSPGTAHVTLEFRLPTGISSLYGVPALDFGTATVNATTRLRLSDSRWILFLRGPRLGPAVLFWSLLLVLVGVAIGLGSIPWVPLRRFEWALLAIGLSQIPLVAAAVVVGWLLALGFRRIRPEAPPLWFDLRQLVLVGWTVTALGILVFAVQQGLMGSPDMQIRGNGSSADLLQWFSDRTAPVPESPFVVSVPMIAYRAAMLAWALWLAVSVLRWLKWAWESFSAGGLWKRRAKRMTLATPNDAPPPPTDDREPPNNQNGP
jgi:hypothetical protein